jgi:hypothetical protein
MSNSRQLAPCAYFVASMLVAIPVFDASMSLVPFHLGTAQWRFAAVGLFSNALMIPASGVLIAVATAVTLGHVRVQRVLAVACWIVAAVLVVALVGFSLDALQTRSAVQPAMYLSFAVASVTAAAKLALGAVAFVLFARACRPPRRSRGSVSVPQTPLLRRELEVPSRG